MSAVSIRSVALELARLQETLLESASLRENHVPSVTVTSDKLSESKFRSIMSPDRGINMSARVTVLNDIEIASKAPDNSILTVSNDESSGRHLTLKSDLSTSHSLRFRNLDSDLTMRSNDIVENSFRAARISRLAGGLGKSLHPVFVEDDEQAQPYNMTATQSSDYRNTPRENHAPRSSSHYEGSPFSNKLNHYGSDMNRNVSVQNSNFTNLSTPGPISAVGRSNDGPYAYPADHTSNSSFSASFRSLDPLRRNVIPVSPVVVYNRDGYSNYQYPSSTNEFPPHVGDSVGQANVGLSQKHSGSPRVEHPSSSTKPSTSFLIPYTPVSLSGLPSSTNYHVNITSTGVPVAVTRNLPTSSGTAFSPSVSPSIDSTVLSSPPAKRQHHGVPMSAKSVSIVDNSLDTNSSKESMNGQLESLHEELASTSPPLLKQVVALTDAYATERTRSQSLTVAQTIISQQAEQISDLTATVKAILQRLDSITLSGSANLSSKPEETSVSNQRNTSGIESTLEGDSVVTYSESNSHEEDEKSDVPDSHNDGQLDGEIEEDQEDQLNGQLEETNNIPVEHHDIELPRSSWGGALLSVVDSYRKDVVDSVGSSKYTSNRIQAELNHAMISASADVMDTKPSDDRRSDWAEKQRLIYQLDSETEGIRLLSLENEQIRERLQLEQQELQHQKEAVERERAALMQLKQQQAQLQSELKQERKGMEEEQISQLEFEREKQRLEEARLQQAKQREDMLLKQQQEHEEQVLAEQRRLERREKDIILEKEKEKKKPFGAFTSSLKSVTESLKSVTSPRTAPSSPASEPPLSELMRSETGTRESILAPMKPNIEEERNPQTSLTRPDVPPPPPPAGRKPVPKPTTHSSGSYAASGGSSRSVLEDSDEESDLISTLHSKQLLTKPHANSRPANILSGDQPVTNSVESFTPVPMPTNGSGSTPTAATTNPNMRAVGYHFDTNMEVETQDENSVRHVTDTDEESVNEDPVNSKQMTNYSSSHNSPMTFSNTNTGVPSQLLGDKSLTISTVLEDIEGEASPRKNSTEFSIVPVSSSSILPTQVQSGHSAQLGKSSDSARLAAIEEIAGKSELDAKYPPPPTMDVQTLQVMLELIQGKVFTKLMGGLFTSHKRIFWLDLTQDDLCIRWQEPNMGGPSNPETAQFSESISLGDLQDVEGGRCTPLLLKKGNKKKEALYFGIIGQKRNLDLECENQHTRDMWVYGLKRLISEVGLLQDILMWLFHTGRYSPNLPSN